MDSEIIQVRYKQDLIHGLVENLVPLDKSKLVRLGDSSLEVYTQPLKCSRRFLYGGKVYVDDYGTIENLNLHDQVELLGIIKDRKGYRLRHMSLGENFVANLHPQTIAYRINVLDKHWVHTSEVIYRASGDEYQIRRVLWAESGVHRPKSEVLFECDGIFIGRDARIETHSRVGITNPIQTGIALQPGYFNKFAGHFPTKEEILTYHKTDESKGHLISIYLENDEYAYVVCTTNITYNGMFSVAAHGKPMDSTLTYVIGVATDEA